MTTPPRLPPEPRRMVVQEETSVLLAHPAERPEALIRALDRELSALPTVTGAWLMLAIRPGQGQSWMLGIEQSGTWADVEAALGRAIRIDDLVGRPLDAIEIGHEGLSDTLRTGIPVLGRRGSSQPRA